MKHFSPITFFCLLFLFFISCGQEKINNKVKVSDKGIRQSKTILIQPLGRVKESTIGPVKKELEKYFSKVELQGPINIPSQFYSTSTKKYSSDSILNWLEPNKDKNAVVLAITHYDIATNMHGNPYYGILGYGFSKTQSCVISDKRLRNKNLLYKLALHELGHTYGLSHCLEKNCTMRSANGKDHTAELNGFCSSCKKTLEKQHWKFE